MEEGTTLNPRLNHTFANGNIVEHRLRAVDYDSQQKEFSHVSVKADDHTLMARRARHLKTVRDYKNFDSSLGMDFPHRPGRAQDDDRRHRR